MHSKLDIVNFQIYPELIPFQFNVGTQYYFSFVGNGKQTTIFLQKKKKYVGSEFTHLLETDNIATSTEPSFPHPLLQKLGSFSKQYILIVDSSMKAVFDQYFVENQTMKALAKFLEIIKAEYPLPKESTLWKIILPVT